jgi:hypothetical protein
MDVMIVETKTGKAVATVPVVLKGLNYTPSEEEYFSAAWECAVEDGAVDPKQRATYTIKLVSSAKGG